MKDTNEYSEIVQLLRRYKSNLAKIQLYNIEIEGLEETLALGKLSAEENENDCIEGLCMKANTITDMPLNKNNLFRSTTENAAGSYRSEMKWESDDTYCKNKIRELKSRMYRLEIEVRQVDAMLTVLSREKRFIVEQYYIEGHRWPEVMDQFELNFKQNYTLNTLYAWRDKALDLINGVCGKCG